MQGAIGDPALVYEKSPPAGGPGTHVLIVGIGTYDYLIDGIHQNDEVAEGMQQVPSAAKSARTLAEWFLENFENCEMPLASLALVLSEDEPAVFDHARCTVAPHALPDGSVDSVSDATVEWIKRASVAAGSQIVLYFVGHGLYASNSVLLCRDFGRRTDARFDGSINLDAFLIALETTPPDYQLILVDACRTPDRITNMTLGKGVYGRGLLSPRDPAERGGSVATQSVHFATSQYTEAWSRPDTVSLYCTALVQALAGGGMQPHLDWWITTSGLQIALSAYVTRLATAAKVDQSPDRTRSGQFNVTRPLNYDSYRVPVYVTCDPDTVWSLRFRLQAEGPERDELLHDPASDSARREWSLTLPADRYSFSVHFGDGKDTGDCNEYVDAVVSRKLVTPPEMPICLPVRRKEPQ